MQKLKAALIGIFYGSPQTRSSGRRDILHFKANCYQRRCRSDKLFAEILPDVKAGWVANKFWVVADEISTLPYRPLRLFACITCYQSTARL